MLVNKRALLPYTPTPLQEVHHPLLERAGIQLLVKREDLNHPTVSGNKWWKLKYNLIAAQETDHRTILTFGGAFSNHIYATAAAAAALKLNSIGVVRGEERLPLNPTLQFATQHGMKLHYISRAAYRQKDDVLQLDRLKEAFGSFYLIPEGGTNAAAITGCEAFGRLIDEIASAYICLPVGTGGTAAGILRSLSPGKQLLGFSVLRGGTFLREEIQKWSGGKNENQFELLTGYAYGGYGKRDETVAAFIRDFYQQTRIPLDFIYTGKMMCGIFDLVRKQYFDRGTTILAIHTGGLQGHS